MAAGFCEAGVPGGLDRARRALQSVYSAGQGNPSGIPGSAEIGFDII